MQRIVADLARGGQDAQRDRQVEAARFFRQVGRRQVDRDAACWDVEAGILQRRAHAVFRFAHFGIGQADDGDARKAVGQVDFDVDGGRFHAGQGAASQDGQTHSVPSA